VLPALVGALLAAASAEAQTRLHLEVEAGRVEAVARDDASVVVYQADETTDLKLVGERVIVDDGRETRQRFEVLAEAAVAFFDSIAEARRPGRQVPIRALYLEGTVWIRVTTEGRGPVVLRAEQAFLDFVSERAFLRETVLRVQAQEEAVEREGLVDQAFVLRARDLHAKGPDLIEGRDAAATVCDFGDPHFALTGRRLTVVSKVPPPPRIPAASPALGGVTGSLVGQFGQRPRLLAAVHRPRPRGPRRQGSDAMRRLGRDPRQVSMDGVGVKVLGTRLPLLPFMTWGTDWPVPELRVGHSSLLGNFGHLGITADLFDAPLPWGGRVRTVGSTAVDYFERRGTAGAFGLGWRHESESGGDRGEGFVRVDGLEDRGDEDRVGTAIDDEERFWARAYLRQRLLPTPEGTPRRPQLRAVVDAEVSRISDEGYLLEYHREVAKTEKEQETYAHLRLYRDEVGLRVLSRHRVNDFQSQLESLPEARLDFVHTPLLTDAAWGGLYLDLAGRGGHLRQRFRDSAALDGYRAWRSDLTSTLIYKNALGPVVARGWGAARHSAWSQRADAFGDPEERSIERLAGSAGWSLALPVWRRWSTPWGPVRHDLRPEVGSRHVFGVTTERDELLAFDDVEDLVETDHLFLRLRTTVHGDVNRAREKLIDFAAEVRYYPRDRGDDTARRWSTVSLDLRLNLLAWLRLRARAEQDVNAGELAELNVYAELIPYRDLFVKTSYQQLAFVETSRTFSWTVEWKLTDAWALGFSQQYDFETRDWLRHEGRLVRIFHRFAIQVVVSHDPQQKDTSASVNFAPLLDGGMPFFSQERGVDFYERQ
jgi:hypothetical protein